MNKYCIFDNHKTCNQCGDCDACDLIKGKICDNCGDCMKTNDSEFRQVLIDEINEGDIYNLEETTDTPISAADDGDEIELIDDIEGLSELINEPEAESVEEVFPGLLRLRKR